MIFFRKKKVVPNVHFYNIFKNSKSLKEWSFCKFSKVFKLKNGGQVMLFIKVKIFCQFCTFWIITFLYPFINVLDHGFWFFFLSVNFLFFMKTVLVFIDWQSRKSSSLLNFGRIFLNYVLYSFTHILKLFILNSEAINGKFLLYWNNNYSIYYTMRILKFLYILELWTYFVLCFVLLHV